MEHAGRSLRWQQRLLVRLHVAMMFCLTSLSNVLGLLNPLFKPTFCDKQTPCEIYLMMKFTSKALLVNLPGSTIYAQRIVIAQLQGTAT